MRTSLPSPWIDRSPTDPLGGPTVPACWYSTVDTFKLMNDRVLDFYFCKNQYFQK